MTVVVMPSFTAQLPDLVSTGPIVELLISPARELVEALEAENKGVPASVKTIAMIDTGATSSVARPDLIRQMGIEPIGLVKISTPSDTEVECLQYQASFIFPNNVAVETSELIAAPLQGQPIQCLIGRDVLEHGVFIYNGYAQIITLSF